MGNIRLIDQFKNFAPGILTAPFWMDFTRIDTLFIDNVGTPITTDGQFIKVVKDANGTAFAMNATAATNHITYKTNIVNGKSVGRFAAGTNRYLELLATTAPSNGITTGAALPLSNQITRTGATVILAANFTADATQRGAYSDNVGGYWYARYLLSGGQVQFLASAFDSGTDKQAILPNFPNSTWQIITYRQGATQLQIRRNAGAWTTVGSTGPASLVGSVRFGTGFTSNGPIVDLAHHAVFKSALTDAECLQVEQAFGASVGVSVP